MGPAGPGGSKAQVITCDDGRDYVVKFKENPQGLRVLVNELVAGELASLLELPCAEVATVEIQSDFLELNRELRSQYSPMVSTGSHFGIVEVKEKWRHPPRPLIARVANKEDLPGIVLFDVWTLNGDRNNDGNYLIVRPSFAPKRFYFSTIDHGLCFGRPGWDMSISAQVDSRDFQILPELANEIRGPDPFAQHLSKAESVTDAQLEAIVNGVPADWQVTTGERQSLANFLKSRRGKLAQILKAVKGQFPFWTG